MNPTVLFSLALPLWLAGCEALQSSGGRISLCCCGRCVGALAEGVWVNGERVFPTMMIAMKGCRWRS